MERNPDKYQNGGYVARQDNTRVVRKTPYKV